MPKAVKVTEYKCPDLKNPRVSKEVHIHPIVQNIEFSQ